MPVAAGTTEPVRHTACANRVVYAGRFPLYDLTLATTSIPYAACRHKCDFYFMEARLAIFNFVHLSYFKAWLIHFVDIPKDMNNISK